MEEFFTATKAREMSTSNASGLKQTQLKAIYKYITEQVNRGLESVTIDTSKIPEFYTNSKSLIRTLEEFGYRVEHHSNQRDGDYIFIEW